MNQSWQPPRSPDGEVNGQELPWHRAQGTGMWEEGGGGGLERSKGAARETIQRNGVTFRNAVIVFYIYLKSLVYNESYYSLECV